MPDPRREISRVHAKIYFENNIYYIEDLSTNGVFVGDFDHRIERVPHAIDDGDKLFIGHYHIEVDIIKEERASNAIFDSPQVSQRHSSPAQASSNRSAHARKVDNIEPFAADDFLEVKSKASFQASAIPENWLNGSIDNLMAGWSRPEESLFINPLGEILADSAYASVCLPQQTEAPRAKTPKVNNEAIEKFAQKTYLPTPQSLIDFLTDANRFSVLF
ncbi:MAG: putative component of type VI protein secretion system [Cellvibrionaceae bacterium]